MWDATFPPRASPIHWAITATGDPDLKTQYYHHDDRDSTLPSPEWAIWVTQFLYERL